MSDQELLAGCRDSSTHVDDYTDMLTSHHSTALD